MSYKVKGALVVSDSRRLTTELTAGAALMAEKVYLAYHGQRDDAINADEALFLDCGSFVNSLDAICDYAREIKAGLILCAPDANGRLAAAYLAARFCTSALCDCMKLEPEEDGAFVSTRMVFGGAGVKKERAAGEPVIACPAAGAFAAGDEFPASSVKELIPAECIKVAERRSREVKEQRMTSAKTVIGVGRGLSSGERLPLIRELAAALEAEIGCTRPVAEENGWLTREHNIGISGAAIRPNLYLALGISGQIQHMVGVNEARTIAAVNKDENAPIFKSCDIGIVGDLAQILPELIKRFKDG